MKNNDIDKIILELAAVISIQIKKFALILEYYDVASKDNFVCCNVVVSKNEDLSIGFYIEPPVIMVPTNEVKSGINVALNVYVNGCFKNCGYYNYGGYEELKNSDPLYIGEMVLSTFVEEFKNEDLMDRFEEVNSTLLQ